MPICKECNGKYQECEDDENFETGFCYCCFEGALEDYEEKRRERIARDNEY